MKKRLFLLLVASILLPAWAQPSGTPPGGVTETAQDAGNDATPTPALVAPESETPGARVKSLSAHSPEEALAVVQPVLIGKRYLDQAAKNLAVQLAKVGAGAVDPQTWMEENALVAQEFVADVRIIYVLEFPEGAQLVSQGMMRSWGMDLGRLHQRALANLDRQHGDIKIKPVGKLPWLHVIDTDDGFAASRVLLHWRWAELTLKLGEALILGMPTRDVVVFTASLDRKKLEQLRDTVETVERYQGRPISRRLFQWTPQGWQEFDESGLPASEQPQEQEGEQAQQNRRAEGQAVEPPAQPAVDVAGQAAQAEAGAQGGKQGTGNNDGDQQNQEPLQHRE